MARTAKAASKTKQSPRAVPAAAIAKQATNQRYLDALAALRESIKNGDTGPLLTTDEFDRTTQ